MDCSNDQYRIISKATKEELAHINSHLSHKTASELHQIIQAAAYTSAEVARVLLRVIEDDTSTNKHKSFQPVKPSEVQQLTGGHQDIRSCTLSDSAEDSEMSGTDNDTCTFGARRPPFFRDHALKYPESTSSAKTSARPAKRKYLADREENVPSPRITLHKKRKSLEKSPDAKRSFFNVNSPTSQKHRCVNCSRFVNGHEWENLHGCIHHPGFLTAADIWSCCQSTSLVRGCLIAKHSEVPRKIVSTSTMLMMPEQMVT